MSEGDAGKSLALWGRRERTTQGRVTRHMRRGGDRLEVRVLGGVGGFALSERGGTMQ